MEPTRLYQAFRIVREQIGKAPLGEIRISMQPVGKPFLSPEPEKALQTAYQQFPLLGRGVCVGSAHDYS